MDALFDRDMTDGQLADGIRKTCATCRDRERNTAPMQECSLVQQTVSGLCDAVSIALCSDAWRLGAGAEIVVTFQFVGAGVKQGQNWRVSQPPL